MQKVLVLWLGILVLGAFVPIAQTYAKPTFSCLNPPDHITAFQKNGNKFQGDVLEIVHPPYYYFYNITPGNATKTVAINYTGIYLDQHNESGIYWYAATGQNDSVIGVYLWSCAEVVRG